MSLKAITVDTGADPDRAVIWLHGLGASGHDFAPVAGQLALPSDVHARFIFPHAPVQAVTLNSGTRMPAWYDLYGLDKDSPEDAEGLKHSKSAISLLIGQLEESGIPPSRVVLAGFSQGGALGLYTGLAGGLRLAGILALSCYLPLWRELPAYAANADRAMPILLAHGNRDEVIPVDVAGNMRNLLEQEGFTTVSLRTYACEHTVVPEEIEDIRNWLLQCWQ